MVFLLGWRVRAKRFADGTAVRRQVYLGHREARARRAVINRGVVILDTLRDRRAKPLPVRTGRDPLPFVGSLIKPPSTRTAGIFTSRRT